MSENLNSNYIEKDDFNLKTEDSNYEDLIQKPVSYTHLTLPTTVRV